MVKNIEDKVKIVNGLLAKAFGEGTKGNYMRDNFRHLEPDKDEENYLLIGKLRLIVGNGLFGKIEIGHFLKSDGSSIILKRRGFLWKSVLDAKEYAGLYEKKFGKEVKIKRGY